MIADLNHLHGVVVYLLVAGLVVGESGFVVGFFIPGETSVIVGGVLAHEHKVNLIAMLLVANAAAIVAFLIGYAMGQLIGPWLLRHRPLRGHPEVERTRHLVARWGGPAVLIGRFLPVVRAVIPAIVGISDVPLATFVIFDVIGGVVWATLYTFVGYGLGTGYPHLVRAMGAWTFAVAGAIVVGLLAMHLVRHRRRRRGSGGPASAIGHSAEAEPEQSSATQPDRH